MYVCMHVCTYIYKHNSLILTLASSKWNSDAYLKIYELLIYGNIHCNSCGPGSPGGIATGYGLDGPWIEFL
jgi:hypothetical protein